MSSFRRALSPDQLELRNATQSGVLGRTAPLPPGILGSQMETWRATQQGAPLRAPSPTDLLHELIRRAEQARTVEELSQVAADAAAVRTSYEKAGILTAPRRGDESVERAVKDAITEPMSALQKIIAEAVFETASEGLDQGIRKGVATALWEVTKEIIEARVGKLAKEVAAALKSGKPKNVLKAAAQATADLAASFSNRDGMMRELLRVMRRNGIVLDKQLEAAVRRYLARVAEKCATTLAALAKLLVSPVAIFLRIFFTPARTASDSEMRYLDFKSLEQRIRRRYRQLAPVPEPKSNGAPIERPPPGPALRPLS